MSHPSTPISTHDGADARASLVAPVSPVAHDTPVTRVPRVAYVSRVVRVRRAARIACVTRVTRVASAAQQALFVVAASLSLLALAAPATQAQAPFPGDLPGVNIGVSLPTLFESSGIVWHPRLQKLFLVGDEGHVASMEANGTLVKIFNVAGDLEAITIADPETDFVYVGVEDPPTVLEVSVTTGAVSRAFDLSPWIHPVGNQGMEALTFVPNAANPEGGVFHAGHQEEGRVYVFSLPVKTSAVSTAVTFLSSYVPIPGATDLADLAHDPASHRIYAVYDGPDLIAALSETGALLQSWSLPGGAQEGVYVRGCELFIAQDVSKSVLRYASFPSAASCVPLSQDAAALSLSAPGTAVLSIHATPPVAAGHFYLLLGSSSGQTPGFDLLGAHVPLVPDAYFDVVVANTNGPLFPASTAPFDATLTAETRLVLPAGLPPTLVGAHLTHAWIGADLSGPSVSAVSNAVELVLIP